MPTFADLNPANPAGTDLVSGGDDILRLIQAACQGFAVVEHDTAGKQYRPYADGGGSANAHTLSLSHQLASIPTGFPVFFKAAATNTAAATLTLTLNAVSMGAKALKKGGAALVGGEIVTGQLVLAVYDGTNFEIVSTGIGVAGNLPTGVPVLLVYQDGGFTELNTASVETSLGAVTVPTNTYTYLKIEALIQGRNETTSTRTFDINIKEAATTRLALATVAVTLGAGGSAKMTILEPSVIIAGGQASFSCSVTATPSVSSADLGVKLLALRVWGIR